MLTDRADVGWPDMISGMLTETMLLDDAALTMNMVVAVCVHVATAMIMTDELLLNQCRVQETSAPLMVRGRHRLLALDPLYSHQTAVPASCP